MWLWHHLRLGLRSLLRRDGTDRDLAEEMQNYLEAAVAELEANGVAPDEARRQVRLRYGDGLAEREQVRDYGWERVPTTIGADLRVAGRRLRRDPGFTVVAVATLGLGVGATTAIFSAVSPVLFEALPYPDADRILAVSDRSPDGTPVQVTFGTYLELSARNTVFESLSVFKPWQPTLTSGDEAERLDGQRVSAGYFDVLGVQPQLGSGFDSSADRPGGRDELVISDDLWRQRFEADPTIIGQVVLLDSTPFTVVGVMGPSFVNVTAPLARAWALLQYDPRPVSFDGREWGHHLDLVARTRDGIGIDEARMGLSDVAGRPIPQFSRPAWATMTPGLQTLPLRDAVARDARPTMRVLLGAVALLLAIACVNLTILLLARGARRQGELAMRVALGAGRGRLAAYLLTESLLLAGLGGVVGLVLAELGLAGLTRVSPDGLMHVESISIDGAALLFALVLTSIVAVFFGLLPLLLQSEGRLPTSNRTTGTGRHHRILPAPQALVATEVAVAVVLLVGAGLLLRSTQRLFATPPGFDTSETVVLQISTTGLEPGDAVTHRFFDEALRSVETVPGVRSAGLTSQLPLTGDIDMYGVTRDEAGRSGGADGSAYRYAVTPAYLQAMRIPLVRGRALEPRDAAEGAPVAVLSESLARRLYPDRDPVGARLHFGAVENAPYTIVGVVGDVKQVSLAAGDADAVYVPSRRWHWADRVRWLVVRADRDAEALVPALRAAIRAVDPHQPIVRVQTLEDLVARSEARRRFVLIVLAAFALSALALAGVGLFGVLSGAVTERRREIGVRGALGASQGDIVTLVVRRGMLMTAVGVGAGLVGALSASEMLVSLLFEVTRLDVATYAGVVLVLGVVSAIACWIPAARAARVDPASILRSQE